MRYTLRYIYLLFIVGVFYSCSVSTKNTPSVFVYHDSIRVSPSPKEPIELINTQPMLAFGKIEQIVFTDSMKAERNLISQISAYNSAILHGDINTCASYLYPDAVKYMRHYYSGFNDDEILAEMFKEISGDMQKAFRKLEENGVCLNIVVPNFVRRVEVDSDIIIVFNTTSNICSETVFTHFKEMNHQIGISQNGGVNWWFIAENEDTPTILKMRYTQDVVNKVMGYSL